MVSLHPISLLIHLIPSTSETIISDLFTPTSYSPKVSDPLRFMSVDSSFTHGSMICLCVFPKTYEQCEFRIFVSILIIKELQIKFPQPPYFVLLSQLFLNPSIVVSFHHSYLKKTIESKLQSWNCAIITKIPKIYLVPSSKSRKMT